MIKKFLNPAARRRRLVPEADAEGGAGAPFVLVDDHDIVVEDGVAHVESGGGVVAVGEVPDDGDALVENHVEADVFGVYLCVVEGNFV